MLLLYIYDLSNGLCGNLWSGRLGVFSRQRWIYVDVVQRTKLTDYVGTFRLEDLGSLYVDVVQRT